jgi:starch synthase (maltosyl-transferring)
MTRVQPARSARRRVVVEGITPEVDGGALPAKRILGDRVVASCDLICDGHDVVAGALLHRGPRDATWRSAPVARIAGDRFEGSFVVSELGVWAFAVEAWVDPYATWRAGLRKKLDAGQDVEVDLATGALLLRAAADRCGTDAAAAAALTEIAVALGARDIPQTERFARATTAAVALASALHPDLADATTSDERRILVDPPRARFSAWYELFPRSAGPAGRHGTLRDCVARLPYVAAMGFDVLYLPPVHPIGLSFRKGRNNATSAGPRDVGSPWAIGSPHGGHKSVHPELGTLDDLRALVREARAVGIELAVDVALQASPDHPYVKEHPEWFLHRPDGSIQSAENPPKKYEDVVPFDFGCDAWESLWAELASIFLFWCEQGLRVFRVDNPHTKPLAFWQWCLAEVKAAYPDVVFLAEAFTRPAMTYALAKRGFSQSYTYFTWRQSKREFTQYMTELTRPPVVEFFRPNFWPNTPDILPEHLQYGGRPVFVQRLVLAATLSSNFGIYGPPFELMEHEARAGAEEYLDSEKYELRAWDLDRPDSLRDVIALVNRIRRAHRALQDNRITFHPTDSDAILAFSKRSEDGASVVLVVVNLDPHRARAATIDLDLDALGLEDDEAFQVHDVLADARYRWRGRRAYVDLDPGILPASIFVVQRHVRSEQDFDYFA